MQPPYTAASATPLVCCVSRARPATSLWRCYRTKVSVSISAVFRRYVVSPKKSETVYRLSDMI